MCAKKAASVSEGMSFHVEWNFLTENLQSLLAGLNALPVFDSSVNGGTQRFQLRITENETRVDLLEHTLFGADHSLIFFSDRPTIWLLHPSRVYHTIEPAEAPSLSFERRLRSEVSIADDEPPVRHVTISLYDDASGEVWEQHLWTQPDLASPALTSRAIQFLFGCTDCLTEGGYPLEEVIAQGFPLRGELYRQSNPREERIPVARFELTDLSVGPLPEDTFTIPADYRDLRAVRKDGQWPKGTPGLRAQEPFTIQSGDTTAALRMRQIGIDGGFDGFDGGGSGTIQPGRRPNGGREPDEPEVPDTPPPRPQCMPATLDSTLGLYINQRLLDDIRLMVNLASERLSAFPGRNGLLSINWLAQLKAHAAGLTPPNGPGASIFCLLRDEPTTTNPVGGTGLIDKTAEHEARRLVAAGPLPGSLTAGFTSTDTANLTAAGTDYDKIAEPTKTKLREAVLAQNYASFNLPYPANPPGFLVFEDLLWVVMSNIEVDFEPRNTRIFTKLDCKSSGSIDGTLVIPYLAVSADILRSPSAKYNTIAAVTIAACLLTGVACALAGTLIAAGIFLAFDIGKMGTRVSPLTLDFTIGFPRDPNSGVLTPRVTASASGPTVGVYNSSIPEPIHQIVSLIITAILSWTSVLISNLSRALERELTKTLRMQLGDGFPASFVQLGFEPIGGTARGKEKDHIYLESKVRAAPSARAYPFITNVDVWPYQATLKEVAAFLATGPHHFASLTISQNFLNHYITALWDQDFFTYHFNGGELQKMVKLFPPGLPPAGAVAFARLWAATPPRLQLAPAGRALDQFYMLAFFDDLRLCLAEIPVIDPDMQTGGSLEIAFAGRVPAQIGFGARGAPQPSGFQYLDLLKASRQFFDVYFNLDLFILEPMEVFDLNTPTGPGPLARINDYCPLLELAVRFAFAGRSARVIPRFPNDKLMQQTYPLDGRDPTLGSGILSNKPGASQHFVPITFNARRGYVYAHQDFRSLVNLVLEGQVDPNTLDCAAGAALRPKG